MPNGGFEDGNLNGWSVTLHSTTTAGLSTVPPASVSDLNLLAPVAGQVSRTKAVQGTGTPGQPNSALPKGLPASGSLRYPFNGSWAAVVNEAARVDGQELINKLDRTFNVTAADVDPADGKIHVRFAVAPVLEDNGHTDKQQPYFFVAITNVTKSKVLFQSFNFAGQAGVPWKVEAAKDVANANVQVRYTDWQLVDVAPGTVGLAIGDQVRVEVIAAGCSQKRHFGEVYVDGFGSSVPGLAVAATAVQSVNRGDNITYLHRVTNGSTALAQNAVVKIVVPANTTFVSVAPPPGTSCTTPAVGSTGTVTCTMSALNSNASADIKLTVKTNASMAVPGLISHGNYDVSAVGFSPLIGPLVKTNVTGSVTYADLRTKMTASTAAAGWGSDVSYTIEVTNDGPATVTNATLKAPLPPELASASWTCVASTGGSCGAASGTGAINSTITLPAGATATYAVSARVRTGSGAGSLIYTATAAVPAGITDSDPTNDAAATVINLGTTRALTVTKDAVIGGRVVSSPGGIDCGAGCSSATATYLDGSLVSLTAIAPQGTVFTGWSGGTCTGTTNPCVFNINGGTTVQANFSYVITSGITGGNGTISCTTPVAPGATSTCSLTPNAGYGLGTLTDNGSDVLSSVSGGSYEISNVQAPHDVVATFKPAKTLTVTKDAGISGNVTSSPAGIACAAGCGSQSATFDDGSQVSLTATAPAGTVFTGWSGTACSGTTNPCTFTIGANTSVHANFAYEITSSIASGNGTISCTSLIAPGAVSTCTVTPGVGRTLTGVTGCGAGTLNGNTYTTAAVTEACTVTATFSRTQYTVTTQVPGGGGSLTPSNPTPEHGDPLTVTVNPDPGYQILTVTGCGGTLNGNTYSIASITGDCTVTATFEKIPYTVTTQVVGTGTLTPANPTVLHGDTTTLTATAGTGYTLDSVTGCGGSLSGNTFTTGAVTASCTVTATFSRTQYTVTTQVPGGGGSLTPSNPTPAHGDPLTVTVNPDPGYQIQTVTGCGGTLNGNTYSIASVTGDCTVTATFEKIPYTVTTQVVGTGTLTPANPTVLHGDTTTLTATAGTGYTLDSVTGCGGSLSGNTFTTGAVTASCTVTATFSRTQYTVTTQVPGGGGSLTPSNPTPAHGDPLTVTVNPDPGYQIQTVTGCGGTLNGNTYSIASVTGDCTVTATFEKIPYTVTTQVVGTGTLTPANPTVLHGDTTTLTATAGTGYTLDSVTGCGGSLSGNTFTTGAVTASCTVTATFSRTQYTVTTQVPGGGGSLTPSNPTPEHGDPLTVTVNPDPGYQIQTVTGCGGTLNGNTYSIASVTGDCTVTATFEKIPYTVTTQVVGTGTLTPANPTVLHDDTTTLTASAGTGYTLDSVTGCGGSLSGNTFTTGAVTASCTVTATFSRTQYTVTTQVPGGGGSLTPSNPTPAHGDSLTVTVTPDPGYQIQTVTGCGGTLNGNTYSIASVTGDCTVTATFEKIPYTVTTQVVGTGTLTPANPTVLHGDTTTLTATAGTGYTLDSVTGCGGSLNGDTFTTGAITASCTVTATFSRTQYTVTTQVPGGGGSLTPSNPTPAHGDSLTVTVNPDPGYQIQTVTGCGGTLNGNTYSIASVTGDCTVTATFEKIPYTVTTQVVGTGTLTPANPTVLHGDTTTLTATAGTGYTLDSVTGCGGSLNGDTFTTGAITASCTVTATFSRTQYTVTTQVPGGGGSLTPSNPTPEHGDPLTVTVNPDPGYQIQTVTGCGGTLNGNTYSIASVTGDCTVTATFERIEYLVTTVVVGGGALTPENPSVLHGDSLTLTATAQTGYTLESVTGCGGVLTAGTFETGAITANCTVTATFTHNRYTVDIVVNGGGSATPEDPVIEHGDAASITLTADPGYRLHTVTGCGGTLSGNTYTTDAVTADCTIEATFLRFPHALLVSAREPVVNACAESILDLQLVDAFGAPVVPFPGEAVNVSLAASAGSGDPRFVGSGLEDALGEGTAEITGRMPSTGTSTVTVSLDAAEVLAVSWTSPELPGSPPSYPPTLVSFRVGPVDPAMSSVTVDGTQVFAGSGVVTVTVTPRDSCGLEIGPGHQVDLTSTDGSLTEVVDNGDGTYTSRFTSDAGMCPEDPATIDVTVDGIVLDEPLEISVLCADLDPGSPVTVLPQPGQIQACARQGEFARVAVVLLDTEGAPLPPGQPLALVEDPPFIVGGGIETSTDEETGATVYTVLVGSNRCSSAGSREVELRVADIPLSTRPLLDFACPPIPEEGVGFVATPAVVPADGETASEIRIAVMDACGNPGFGRALVLRSEGHTPVVLSAASATTADAYGTPEDGTAVLHVRSSVAGQTGIGAQIDGTWHASSADLVTFVGPEDPGYYLGGHGFGCSSTGRTGAGPESVLIWLLGPVLFLAMRRRKVGVLASLLLLLVAAPASAQSKGGFDLQQLRPATDPSRGGFVSLGAGVQEHGEFRLHALIDYANNPLVLYDSQDQRVAGAVTSLGTLHLLGSIGLWDIVEVGVDLPVVVYQAGDDMPGVAPNIVQGAGFGDIRVLPQLQFLKLHSDGLGVTFAGAAAAEFFLPTGNADGLRGGDFRVGPRLAFDATFDQGHRIGTNVGYVYRSPRDFGGLQVADTIGWSLYGETPVAERVRLTGELFGRFKGAAKQPRLDAPMEVLLGAKARVLGVDLLGATGTGFGRTYGTADWRALLAVALPFGERTKPVELPAPQAEVVPEPPAEPEPEPAPEPEPVILVAEPEPEPEPKSVQIDRERNRLEIAGSIQFVTGSATIAPESYALLDELASVLQKHSEIQQLIIEGHTDDRGGRALNLKLSRSRADSLRKYLITKGVESDRLQAEGYGPDRPIASNATAEGRAQNRRVEFRIAESVFADEG
ncbi:InlB B-repeat-containing protein [Vulgatibacter incomptus]|uniref:Outer membrane protein n=1 Tax=Vulgatibacter incomptus TaxID=1391653 RepID=A0A0K1P9D7_9BACT|nr:OmpA family protein [Vulgatibacter incomptus]AKU90127.1 Outer membrane protein [Vulgatibacter incomptus]